MIRIERAECPKQLQKQSSRRAKAERKIQAIIDEGQLPTSRDFDPVWGDKNVRSTLHRMQHGRCCYCEQLREPNRESDIEHFRPKSAVAENPEEVGYWWLAYEWGNLLFACRYCNQEYKKTHFPVRGSRATRRGDSLELEEAVLLDPCKDDSESFLSFDWVTVPEQVIPVGRGDDRARGDATIKICGLDRPSLNERRATTKTSLMQLRNRMLYAQYLDKEVLVKEIGKEILGATSSKRPIEFLAFRRWYFRDMGLGEFVATD